nr:hypothetical protein [Tanacetum cinerariifolium]
MLRLMWVQSNEFIKFGIWNVKMLEAKHMLAGGDGKLLKPSNFDGQATPMESFPCLLDMVGTPNPFTNAASASSNDIPSNNGLRELDEYDLYDGYNDVVLDLTDEQIAFLIRLTSIFENTKVPRQIVGGVHIGLTSHFVYKLVQPKNDKKTDSRQPKQKVLSVTQVLNPTITSNSFDDLGSVDDAEYVRGVGHVNTISDKEMNNLEEHVLKPNRVEVANKVKWVTV